MHNTLQIMPPDSLLPSDNCNIFIIYINGKEKEMYVRI